MTLSPSPPASLPQDTLSQYLHLLALLLSCASQSHTAAEWVGPDDNDELDNEWEGFEEAEFDPLNSSQELLACCVSIMTNRNIPLRLSREQ